jgi:Fe-S-cluster-containing dehydrogenase component
MNNDRRSLLKVVATAGAVAATGSVAARAKERAQAPPDARGMLYDTTLCIGCKACVVACREANNLEPDLSNSPDGLHDTPIDLNGQTKNIIQLFKEDPVRSYVKRQCMQCIDPACVGACMIGSFKKREYGIVTWDPGRCIGCRYCQMACPFNIPKFEWESANPKIVKCEYCKDREGDKAWEPACCEVCPRGAVIAGTHEELLKEAQSRLAANPDRYVPKIYGEHDAGGTQVLYLSHVDFDKIGLPDLGEEAVPDLPRNLQHGLYQGFITPAVLYFVLGAVMFRNRKKGGGKEGADE